MVFRLKMAIFPNFFFGTIGQENVFYDILKRKNTFVGYKNKKFKKSKNWHFSKVDNPWFLVLKWPSFQNFFLGTIGPENVFYDILKRKNTFPGYKKKSSKSRKIDIFPKPMVFGPKMAIFPIFFYAI